jgi:hypothetical protein
LFDRSDSLPGEVRVELDTKEARHEFWPLKQQRREQCMRVKYTAAMSAPTQEEVEEQTERKTANETVKGYRADPELAELMVQAARSEELYWGQNGVDMMLKRYARERLTVSDVKERLNKELAQATSKGKPAAS